MSKKDTIIILLCLIVLLFVSLFEIGLFFYLIPGSGTFDLFIKVGSIVVLSFATAFIFFFIYIMIGEMNAQKTS